MLAPPVPNPRRRKSLGNLPLRPRVSSSSSSPFHPVMPFIRSLTIIALVGAGAFAACAASSPGPPTRDPYCPVALVVPQSDDALVLASANADLKYGAGSMQAYDLDVLSQLVAGWQAGRGTLPAGCVQSPTRVGVAVCPSTVNGARAAYVLPTAVQIGNFASAMAGQALASGKTRIFAAVRGDPSITWVDWDPATKSLDCSSSGSSFPRCDAAHRLDNLLDDPDLGAVTSEPFGVGVDAPGESVIVTHLTTGTLTLLHAPASGDQPIIADILTGIWAPNSFGIITAVDAAVRHPGDPSHLFYVTSRSEARVNEVRVVPPTEAGAEPRLVLARSFFYAPAPAGDGTAGDARGLAFTADGDRMVMVSRSPNSLITFDTSLDAGGRPLDQMVGQVEICSQPSELSLYELVDRRLAYVSCFSSGEVWVVDLESQSLSGVIPVAPGPSALAISSGHKLGFVAEYGNDTVTVIDLDPASPNFNRAVLSLGLERI
jgi:DNA-binding beta-propeller fold protein YncE